MSHHSETVTAVVTVAVTVAVTATEIATVAFKWYPIIVIRKRKYLSCKRLQRRDKMISSKNKREI